MLEGSKSCTKCKEVKPIFAFSIAQNKIRKDGSIYKKYRSQCKPCLKDKMSKHNKEWRERNLEEVRAKARERWRAANPPKEPKPKPTPEEVRERQKKYYAENKERYSEYSKKYYVKNKNMFKEYHKKWVEDNKERLKETRQKWVDKNRERINALANANAKKLFLQNPEKTRHARNEKKKGMKAKDPQAWNEKMRRYNAASQKKMVAELTDAYVRQRLTRSNDDSPRKISAKDIPQSLVEVKRIQLMILRSLKNEKC
jgi:hypothetical protein